MELQVHLGNRRALKYLDTFRRPHTDPAYWTSHFAAGKCEVQARPRTDPACQFCGRMAPSGAAGDCGNAAGSSRGKEGDPRFDLLLSLSKQMVQKSSGGQLRRRPQQSRRRGKQKGEEQQPRVAMRTSFSQAARMLSPQLLRILRRRLWVYPRRQRLLRVRVLSC